MEASVLLGGHAQARPGLPVSVPYMASHKECRSVRAFRPDMGSMVRWPFLIRTVTGQPVGTFRASKKGPIIDFPSKEYILIYSA